MSCEYQLIATFEGISKFIDGEKYDGAENEPEISRKTLQSFKISISPTGEIIVLAKGTWLLICGSKWDPSVTSGAKIKYSPNWHGHVNCKPGEEITSVLCLPFFSQGHSTHGSADWTCIVLGFSSGWIRFYTEGMQELACSILHEERITYIKCFSSGTAHEGKPPKQDSTDIYVLYKSVICVVNKSQLYQTLRNKRNQLAKGALNRDSETESYLSVDFKKYSFTSQEEVSDACFLGQTVVSSFNTFDHLVTASLVGGFNSNYRASPPQTSLIVTSGRKPFVGFHYTLEGTGSPLLSDVALAVASKIKSSVAATLPDWFGFGNKKASHSDKPKEVSQDYAERLNCRFGLCDLWRQGQSVITSPDGMYSAVTDSLGRVTLIDNSSGIAHRMWKGCRDAQCGFLQVQEDVRKLKREKGTHSKPQPRVGLFIVIYAPKKGLIEIFTTQNGRRVTSFKVTKFGHLLYAPGASNMSTCAGGFNLNQSQVLFVSEEGLNEFSVPFHCALAEDNSKISRDLHVLKKIKMLLKMESNSGKMQHIDEIKNCAAELKTDEIRLQTIESMITYRNVTLEAFKTVLKVFQEALQSKERTEPPPKKITALSETTLNLLLFYDFLITLSSQHTSSESAPQTINSECLSEQLKLPQNELDIILKVISQISDIEKTKEQSAKVSFEEKKSVKLAQFLSCFDFETFLNSSDKSEKLEKDRGKPPPCLLNLRPNGKEQNLPFLGEIFFKGLFNSFSSSFDDWKKYLEKCQLNPIDLAFCLLSYWCSKNVSDNTLPEVLVFVEVLKVICFLNGPDTVAVEYNTESAWWKQLRSFLAGNPFSIRGLFAALCCRSVTIFFEQERELSLKGEKKQSCKTSEGPSSNETVTLNNDWETISKDSCQWDILIMQLQDVALLNAILGLTFKTQNKLPEVPFDLEHQSLTSVQANGTGRVSELVAKWLVQFGFEPSALIDSSDIEFQAEAKEVEKGESDLSSRMDRANEMRSNDEDANVALTYLALLKTRFPYSLTSSSLIGNMCWEYFAHWFKNVGDIEYLESAVRYLEAIPSAGIKYGISYLSWNTYLEQKFETLAKIINRIGKVPTEKLCVQEIGLRNDQVPLFLKLISEVLGIMLHTDLDGRTDFGSNREVLWQNSSSPSSSLVVIALAQPVIGSDLILFPLQLSYSLLMMASLNLKQMKLFASLFDSVEHTNFTLSGTPLPNSHHQDVKLRSSRGEFLKKCLTAAVQTIEVVEYIPPVSIGDGSDVIPRASLKVEEYKKWIQICFELARMWAVPPDDLRKHQICELYFCGFDRLAEEVIPSVNDTDVLGSRLLVIGGKRLKYLIHVSNDLSKKLTKLSANLSEWLQTLDLDDFTYEGSIDDIEVLMRFIAKWLPEGHSDHKLAVGVIESLSFLKIKVKNLCAAMDPLYLALSFYKRRNYDKCAELCTQMLQNNPYDQAPWLLKMRALTEKVYIEDLENEEESLADEFLDDNVIAETHRAGTSLRVTTTDGTSRPKTDVGHPVSGVVRTSLHSARSGTMEQTLRSARKARSGRPVTSQSGRNVRMGTASMVAESENFIEVGRMNLAKYATEITGKNLFEYLFYHEGDFQRALELASEASKACESNDWWWTVQMGKCFFYLSLFRASEQNLRKALKQHISIDIFLRLIRVYKKLDQPLSALDACDRALEIFPYEVSLALESARLHEALGNISMSVSWYQKVILKDASNIEAIACTGLHYFYNDQPEIALRFYKRLLQMGLLNAEILNNIGLCCFYSQNYDLALSCFKRALALASGETTASIWYNLSHVAIGIGDLNLARLCLRLCLSADGSHASALNNLGVLEAKRNKLSYAKSFFMAAIRHAPLLFEPHFNHARLAYQCGDLHSSYKSVQKALEVSPNHAHSVQLHNTLQRHFVQIQ